MPVVCIKSLITWLLDLGPKLFSPLDLLVMEAMIL